MEQAGIFYVHLVYSLWPFGIFSAILYILWLLATSAGIFFFLFPSGDVRKVLAKKNILWLLGIFFHFDMLYKEKSGNPDGNTETWLKRKDTQRDTGALCS
jgi:hypothetical protein